MITISSFFYPLSLLFCFLFHPFSLLKQFLNIKLKKGFLKKDNAISIFIKERMYYIKL